MFLGVGNAVARLTGDDGAEVVAGSPDEDGELDGHGSDARLDSPQFLCSDGRGALYCRGGEEGDRIVRLALPPTWQAGFESRSGSGSESRSGSRGGPTPSQPSSHAAGIFGSQSCPAYGTPPAAAATPLEPQPKPRVHVTTLPLFTPSSIAGLAYVASPPNASSNTSSSNGSNGSNGCNGYLVVATETALYRLQLPDPTSDGGSNSSDGSGTATDGTRSSNSSSSDAGTATSGSGGSSGGGRICAALEPLAGLQGARGNADGAGAVARFHNICGVVADAGGAVFVADRVPGERGGTSLRRVAPDGKVTSLVTGIEGPQSRPAILPNGYMALCNMNGYSVLVLDLGLKPAPLLPLSTPQPTSATPSPAAQAVLPAAPATPPTRTCSTPHAHHLPISLGPGGLVYPALSAGDRSRSGSLDRARSGSLDRVRSGSMDGRSRLGSMGGGYGAGRAARSLASDLAALLDGPPDDTSDIVLVVGARRFDLHRNILCARCDYFKRRLAGFKPHPDGLILEFKLADADPDAAAVAVRYIYTGSADIPPALAPAVAELADRLLLPELCAEAQAAVLGGVTPEGVVGLMLWAEARGAAFDPLLAQLKAWCVQHYEQVARVCRGGLGRLAERPGLMAEVLEGVAARGAGGAGGYRAPHSPRTPHSPRVPHSPRSSCPVIPEAL
ncbi:hypothetical protein HYH03_002018 [Edaphochlamys debaryana]|uniref:BTB domain-containing protein n=1 Tax=Edaphochlamys debaryana TaxID=47281 RepID=A0A835YGE0_9CHLO|nr:hypothetical protein HYH03_002018 [Edaphochlamys debaryana]|eukprot:KAG2500451.1 hypothetical protein HYH03_002018 [Edaphochlamys debaryana]